MAAERPRHNVATLREKINNGCTSGVTLDAEDCRLLRDQLQELKRTISDIPNRSRQGARRQMLHAQEILDALLPRRQPKKPLFTEGADGVQG